MSVSPPPALNPKSAVVDRQKTTPFLLNFCYRSAAFHSLTEFPVPTPSDPSPPLPPHLQIYTWYSCTLKELAHLLTTALPHILPDPAIGTRLSFRLVYPDTSPPSGAARSGRLDEGRPRYMSKEIGSVVISIPSNEALSANGEDEGARTSTWQLGGEDADRTLSDSKFVIGDYIDCAIFPPLADGSVQPRGSVGGRFGGGYRENGFGRGGRPGGFGGRGGGGGAGGRGDYAAGIPSGEWRRGERLPEGGGYRGGGGGGGSGSGSGGSYRGGRGRRDPY